MSDLEADAPVRTAKRRRISASTAAVHEDDLGPKTADQVHK